MTDCLVNPNSRLLPFAVFAEVVLSGGGKMKAGSLGRRQILRVVVSENRVFPAASGLGDKKGIPEWEY